jgi:hypothetical protein
MCLLPRDNRALAKGPSLPACHSISDANERAFFLRLLADLGGPRRVAEPVETRGRVLRAHRSLVPWRPPLAPLAPHNRVLRVMLAHALVRGGVGARRPRLPSAACSRCSFRSATCSPTKPGNTKSLALHDCRRENCERPRHAGRVGHTMIRTYGAHERVINWRMSTHPRARLPSSRAGSASGVSRCRFKEGT